MVKFAHIADCHLGGWRQEELQNLNFKSFQKAIDYSIAEKVDFILISGDLFDSAYPPIEILKESFSEFKKIKEANIPVFLIAGSHDFSASGKTFLDVLEKAGFCKNTEKWEKDADGRIRLFPTLFEGLAIYGYPGRKSGMEIEDLKKVYFDSVHPLTVFMLHTTITDVVGNIPIESIQKEKLPLADYYALGHIHKRFEETNPNSKYVYPGPTYPNNFQELVDLKCGSFNIVEIKGGRTKTENILLPLKETVFVDIVLENGLTATQKVIGELDKLNLKDKIVLLKLRGVLTQGKTSDIYFNEIEDFIKKKEAFAFLRNISSLSNLEIQLDIGKSPVDDVENLERNIIKEYSKNNPTNFNKFLPSLMDALSMEKNEDERASIFEERLVSELKEVLELKNEI
jgi:DNA repair exonuclease SbcCD nuclease subunit